MHMHCRWLVGRARHRRRQNVGRTSGQAPSQRRERFRGFVTLFLNFSAFFVKRDCLCSGLEKREGSLFKLWFSSRGQHSTGDGFFCTVLGTLASTSGMLGVS
jgi:hypothetical protein